MAKLSDHLGELKLMPGNSDKVDIGISSTGISYWKTTSLGGTAYYVFVNNTGELRVSTAIPTADTDGVTLSLSTVDAAAIVPVGTRRRSGVNEFVYLQGVTGVDSTHNWVTFDEDNVTTLLAANAKGRVAVFMAAVDATSKFGWAQIYGKCAVAASDTVSDNGTLYIDATAGRVDDAAVTGDLIVGAWARSADTSNVLTVELGYPVVTDALG